MGKDSLPKVYLKGGLGNQLFLVAKAISLSRILNSKVVISNLLMSTPGQNRTFELEKMVDPLFEFGIEFETSPMGVGERMAYYLGQSAEPDSFISRSLHSRGFFHGYYQDWATVDSVSRQMKELISLAIESHPVDNHGAISLHLRRGDYLSLNHQRHGVLSLNYFRKGLDFLGSIPWSNVEPTVVVFSDSQLFESEKDFFSGTANFQIHDSGRESGFEMLAKLSSGSGIVMSNSSLSWWGAWFGMQNHPAFDVVSPFPWFRGQASDLRLYDPSWKLMASEWMEI